MVSMSSDELIAATLTSVPIVPGTVLRLQVPFLAPVIIGFSPTEQPDETIFLYFWGKWTGTVTDIVIPF